MFPRAPFLPLLGASAVLLAAACGHSDTGPSFATSIDTATAVGTSLNAGQFLNNTLVGVYEDQGGSSPNPEFTAAEGRMDPMARALAIMERFRRLATLGAATAPGAAAVVPPPFPSALTCTAHVTGLDSLGYVIDTDGDGVPDDLRVDYGSNCSNVDSAYRYTWSGITEIRDTDSGFASFKYTATSYRYTKTTLATGEFQTNLLDGSESASFLTTGASHRMNITFIVAEQLNSDTSSTTYKIAEVSSFTPTTGALALGDPLPAGTLTYATDYKVLGGTSGGIIVGNFHFLFDTPTPLGFDPACGTGITAGSFRGRLNGDDTIGFEQVWSGCGASTTSLFGIGP